MRTSFARTIFCLLAALLSASPAAARDGLDAMSYIRAEIAAREGLTGLYVLEKGSEALLARAWLADHATQSIEVQYFIWSTDNIGILAMESLLRAADRGVRVRIIVDDLMMDAPDESLLALARHANIDIRIYNPNLSVGVPFHKRVFNAATDLRGVNQRMHDKTFIVDGAIAISGGRNMAAEYYDYNQEYNFRDRDALILGDVVKTMRTNFEAFWRSELSVKVEDLYDRAGFLGKHVRVDDADIQATYRSLKAYAASPENFSPEVHAAIADTPASFPRIAKEIVWCDATFIHDQPGKNNGMSGLAGGGESSAALADLVVGAQKQITIQSPYLVLSDKAIALFRDAIARGVRIRVSTNSLASTDNLAAFSGYRNQREMLLGMGIEVYEYKPAPEIERELLQRIDHAKHEAPVFSLHAKTMVIDSTTVYIGTYNLDPRSENLNTEVGVVARNESLARGVEHAIEQDMLPGNSWDARTDEPDRHASIAKRAKVRALQLVPLKPFL